MAIRNPNNLQLGLRLRYPRPATANKFAFVSGGIRTFAFVVGYSRSAKCK